MSVISIVLLSQVYLILWMAIRILIYLRVSAHGDIMLTTGSDSYYICALCSVQFVTQPHKLVYILFIIVEVTIAL